MNIKVVRVPYTEEEYYSRDFWFTNTSCYSFYCSKEGIVLEDKNTPQAFENYLWCVQHPEKFIKEGVFRHTRTVGGNRIGYCTCGVQFDMYNQYLGTCECPNCGRWYNLFGQEVLAPCQYNANEG